MVINGKEKLMIKYNVIKTGSAGNCLMLNDDFLYDIGIPFKKINDNIDIEKVKIIFISHSHCDHIKKETTKMMIELNKIIFCNSDVYNIIKGWGFDVKNVKEFNTGDIYTYKNGKGETYKIESIPLVHNVLCNGLKFKIIDMFDEETKIIIATDTNNLKGITAKDYDYFFIEENYCEDFIKKIQEDNIFLNHWENGEDSKMRHLSIQQSQTFFVKNKKKTSVFIGLHQSDRFLRIGKNESKK